MNMRGFKMKISKKELAEIRRLVSEARILAYKDSSKCSICLVKAISLLDLIKTKKE